MNNAKFIFGLMLIISPFFTFASNLKKSAEPIELTAEMQELIEPLELKENELAIPKLEKVHFTFKSEDRPKMQYTLIEEPDIVDDATIIAFELKHPSKPLPSHLNYSQLPELLAGAYLSAAKETSVVVAGHSESLSKTSTSARSRDNVPFKKEDMFLFCWDEPKKNDEKPKFSIQEK